MKKILQNFFLNFNKISRLNKLLSCIILSIFLIFFLQIDYLFFNIFFKYMLKFYFTKNFILFISFFICLIHNIISIFIILKYNKYGLFMLWTWWWIFIIIHSTTN
jgi:hypothetical protein